MIDYSVITKVLLIFTQEVGLATLFSIIGFLVLHIKENEEFNSHNLFIKFPIYASLGLLFAVPIFFVVGLLKINQLVLLFVFIIIITLFATKIKRDSISMNPIKLIWASDKSRYLLPLILFLFSSLLFAKQMVAQGEWSAPGDPARHGMFVTLIQYNEKLLFNLNPITSFSDYYPRGFHIIGAIVSWLTGSYPGRGILLLATLVSALLPCILYSMVYIRTKSPLCASISYLMTFFAPQGVIGRLAFFGVFSPFFQGVFPFFFSYLIFLSFSSLDKYFIDRKSFVIMFLLLSLTLFLTYPTFIPYILVFVFFHIINTILFKYKILNIRSKLIRKKYFLIIVSGLVIFLLIIFQLVSSDFMNLRTLILNITRLEGTGYLLERHVPLTFFIQNENGVIILFAAFFSIILMIRNKYYYITLFFFSIFIPFFLSMLSQDFWYNYLIILVLNPKRAPYLLAIMSYVIIPLFIHFSIKKYELEKRFKNRIKPQSTLRKARSRKKHPFYCRLLVYISITLVVLLVMFPHITFSGGLWGRPVGNDYDALVWIDKNVPQNDLILNDRSWQGHFILSMSIKNVVFLPESDWPEEMTKRMMQSNAVLDNPKNYSLMKELIEKWDVKYVFLSSDDAYLDFWSEEGQKTKVYEYRWRTQVTGLSEEEYYQSFDDNPYLSMVFKKGYVRVYETFLVSKV